MQSRIHRAGVRFSEPDDVRRRSFPNGATRGERPNPAPVPEARADLKFPSIAVENPVGRTEKRENVCLRVEVSFDCRRVGLRFAWADNKLVRCVVKTD